MSRPLRIILVDDHQILREGLAALLGADDGFEVVGQAADPTSAKALISLKSPDVCLVDVRLGQRNGISLIRALHALQTRPKAIVLSMYDDEATVRSALAAGADGYVLKGGGMRVLAEAIKAVSQGERWLDPKLPSRALVKRKGGTDRLSRRELSVLKLVAEGFTSAEIGAQLGLATKTVQNHRARIMDKVGLRSTAALTTYALNAGLIDPLPR